ncbi:hypothetical protein Q669_15785 [Labrenzia sp. C1B10]|nr:hypothetical protein Q669_15785 [Labrenzia sp. C1B10]ERS02803.1 hypothetical protein Q675_31785 [Labrenzia sp. C1B70]
MKEHHFLANQFRNAWLSKKTFFLCLQIHSLLKQLLRHKEQNDPSLSFSYLALNALFQRLFSSLRYVVLKVERNAYTMFKIVGAEGQVRQFTRHCRELRSRLKFRSRVPRTWKASIQQAEVIMNVIEDWRDQNILADVYDEARRLMANRVRSDWKIGEHKVLADELGISNTKASKYLNELISRGDLTN